MALTTPSYGLPYPEPTDVPDVPKDIKALAEAIELAINTFMPIGTILPFKPGTAIPQGWQLCNGTNGTPNLAGRVLIGAGTLTGAAAANGVSEAFAAGSTGGFSAVKLTAATSGIGTHTHPVTAANTTAAHTHTVPAQVIASGGQSANHTHHNPSTPRTSGGANRDHSHYIPYSGNKNTVGGGGHSHITRIEVGNALSGTTDRYITEGTTNSAAVSGGGHEHVYGWGGASTQGHSATHEHSYDAGNFATGANSVGHTHSVTVAASTTSAPSATSGTTSLTVSASQPSDAQTAHENKQPYYVVNYIIRVS